MKASGHRSGFSLVELLVVMGIVALLAALSLPVYNSVRLHADCASCTARMRSLGLAFTLYANDNNGHFPGRVTTPGSNRWPELLLPYVNDPRCYADPGDPVASAVSMTDLVSNSGNNSSFFFNGFSDLGAYTNSSIQVGLSNVMDATNLILLGQKINGNTQYYMDFVEGNQDDILNKQAYFGGSNYTFADGSSRFISAAVYNNISAGSTESDGDKMWLINKSYVIPPIPAGH